MMEEKKKMTKKDYFDMLKSIVEAVEVENATELIDFINKERGRLDKKRTGQTKTQKENEVLVGVVYKALTEVNGSVTVSELLQMKDISDAGIGTSQKIVALLKKLVEAGKVVRTVDKKKPYYSVAE